MSTERTTAANVVWIAILLAYLVYAAYGLYLEDKLGRLRGIGQEISRENRWNPNVYPADAAKWLARDRLWHRMRYIVWLGLLFVGGILNVLIRH